ncbi:MAG TPA: hypothetical protein VH024_05805 [Candidatus Angelobacter sp.]|jgi:hypothetical protein|nr:hypothetical protein [Candidatus Angelobacter sp.]
MAIGETPSEPLIARMNHIPRDGPAPSDKKGIAKIAKIAGIAKIENQKTRPYDSVFRIRGISENQW